MPTIQNQRNQLLLDIARKLLDAGDLKGATEALKQVEKKAQPRSKTGPGGKPFGKRTGPAPKAEDFLP